VEPEEKAVARQQLGKRVNVAMNIHPTIEELLDAVCSIRTVTNTTLNFCSEIKVCDYFFPELLVRTRYLSTNCMLHLSGIISKFQSRHVSNPSLTNNISYCHVLSDL
jgi:hypothetical protein